MLTFISFRCNIVVSYSRRSKLVQASNRCRWRCETCYFEWLLDHHSKTVWARHKENCNLKKKVKIVCDDDKETTSTNNKSLEIDSIDAVLENTTLSNNEFIICVVDDVTIWFDRNDENDNKNEARCLKVKCARNRCRRSIFIDEMTFLLIFINIR